MEWGILTVHFVSEENNASEAEGDTKTRLASWKRGIVKLPQDGVVANPRKTTFAIKPLTVQNHRIRKREV